MAVRFGSRIQTLRDAIRSVVVGPQLAAFLPALMLGAYWFGGEGILLLVAVLFPALMAFIGFATRPAETPRQRDPISGLPGRKALIHRLDEGITPSFAPDAETQVCVLVEIDGFSDLARQHGDKGIEAIHRQAADRIRSVLREHDLISGLAPGLFGLAIAKTPRVDLETMIQLSNRLQDALAAPISLDGTRILTTTSIGFALPSRVPEQTGEAYLAAAESALHEAMQTGPGSIRAFTRGMRPRADLPDEITKELMTALENGQIRPWFQPQISTDTGKITGFEALARWHHPEKGVIAPGAFLPAVARGGLQERLGEVILFHALSALREWDRAGFKIPMVAVNFSPEELRNPKLYDKIRWELDRFEIAPDRLTVEVLENVVSKSDDDTTTLNIAALSRLGCGIDLDDFGTGHASISNIRRFDVSRIKIDRSFITHVDTDRDQQNMVAAILTMAERLGLETLGEGVETHGEHAMLAQLGCSHVQGYSIARPMPFEETGAWVTAHQKRIAKAPPISRKAG